MDPWRCCATCGFSYQFLDGNYQLSFLLNSTKLNREVGRNALQCVIVIARLLAHPSALACTSVPTNHPLPEVCLRVVSLLLRGSHSDAPKCYDRSENHVINVCEAAPREVQPIKISLLSDPEAPDRPHLLLQNTFQ